MEIKLILGNSHTWTVAKHDSPPKGVCKASHLASVTITNHLHIHAELIINGNEDSSCDARFYYTNVLDHIIIMDQEMINLEYEVYEVLLENEWNHVCRVTDDYK